MITKEFIEGFVKNTLGRKTKEGTWSIVKLGDLDVLQYTPSDKPNEHEQVACRLPDGSVLSNANVLEFVGRRFVYGYERSKWGTRQEPEQQWLEGAGAIPIPFTLFKESNTDIRDFSWVIKPVAETVIIKEDIYDYRTNKNIQIDTPRHFIGACIFKIGSDTYLFDIDRQELEYNIFNPFLTKLPRYVLSVNEAYDVLIPDEVKDAIKKKIDVKRQGEFFFIRHSKECPITVELTDEEKQILRFPPSRFGFGLEEAGIYRHNDFEPYPDSDGWSTIERNKFQEAALRYKKVRNKKIDSTPKKGTLGKSATGSHTVDKYIQIDEITYVSGTIKQDRRQHHDLVLDGWYKVVPNTGVLSWTITGDID